MSVIQGLLKLSTKVNGRAVGTSKLSVISWVSVKWGSTVNLTLI